MSYKTATIANNASLSSEILVPAGEVLAGIVTPAAWTAAALTAAGIYNPESDTFLPINWAAPDYTAVPIAFTNAELSLSSAVTADTILMFSREVVATLNGVQRLKIRSGTSGSPVNQGAERTLGLIFKPVQGV